MGTEFDVLLNPDGPTGQIEAASQALDEVARLENQYTIYRPESELSRLNHEAAEGWVTVEPELFRLLKRSLEIAAATDGAFNPISGRLIALWRNARRLGTLPEEPDLAEAVAAARLDGVELDGAAHRLRFRQPGPRFNLAAIGKGYAVDRAGARLDSAGVSDWLVHGGKSSALVRGGHAGWDGWPVGLQNPLLPDRRFLTLLLKDMALSTSGTAVQWFRHQGKRYGHIVDPRTGWPVDRMLSVSVIAPDAALADALSTAFFVLGVEKALACCDNFPLVGAILFPYPQDGRTVEPILHNVPADRVFRHDGGAEG
jgi:thiamine biosynthesis lipoprotein